VSAGVALSAPGVQADDDDSQVSVFDRTDVEFDVVRNSEEQYSIWPCGWDMPAGWEQAGFRGLREPCLAHIEEVWVDMRPASVRRWMESQEGHW
jgi:MbtH protein